jgi:hypothetical protein
MRQYFHFKRWQLPAVAMLAALTVASTPLRAFAQTGSTSPVPTLPAPSGTDGTVSGDAAAGATGQPGESSFYNNQFTANTNTVGDPTTQLLLQGTLAEARNGGNQLDVWKAFSGGTQVWMSFNLGVPFQVGKTGTNVSPAVAPYGSSSFIVFQTGNDNNIYWTVIGSDGSHGNAWNQVPGQTTMMAVSVAPMGVNSTNIFLVYRGNNADTAVYGTWMNNELQWSPATNIGGGQALSGPSIALNAAVNELVVVCQGTDNAIWRTTQTLGASSWPAWTSLGGRANFAPSVAAIDNGDTLVDWVDTSNHPEYALFNAIGNQISPTTVDLLSANSGWVTNTQVRLVSAGHQVWSLFTGESPSSGFSFWKQVYNPD